jgi:hypothetical protein
VLPVLLNNLNTFTGIQAVRLPEVRMVLELYPAIAADAFYALPPPTNGVSVAKFGLVIDSGQFCSQGYSASVKRGNLASDWGGAADLSNFCTASSKDNVDERGAQHDPLSQRDGANVTNADPYPGPKYPGPFPGSGHTTSTGSSSSSSSGQSSGGSSGAQQPEPRIVAPFNPGTGTVIGPNGKKYLLGLNGPVAPAFGSNSYKWLLIAPTMR